MDGLILIFQGCSIIRMLKNYLGEDIFKAGLHSYLKKYQYSNAATKDLWNSFSGVSTKKDKFMAYEYTVIVFCHLYNGKQVRLRHMNECRIFHNIHSIAFLLYTFNITVIF